MLEFLSSGATVIACLVIGAILIVVEALTPGFSLPGFVGGILLFAGSVLTWYNYGITAGLIVLLCALLFTLAAVLLSLRSASKGKLADSAIVLEGSSASPEIKDDSALIGMKGTAATPLNPVGSALIDGRKIDVFSDDGFTVKGAKITVTRTEGNKIYVSKCD